MLANWIARQAQQHGSLDGNPAALVFYVPKVRSGTRGQEVRIFPLRPSAFPILQQSIERGLGLFGGSVLRPEQQLFAAKWHMRQNRLI